MLPNEPIVSVTTGLTPGPGSIIETLVNVFIPLSYLITTLNLNIHKRVYIYRYIHYDSSLMPTYAWFLLHWLWYAKMKLMSTYMYHGSVYIDMYTLPNITFLYARLKNGRIMPWQCLSVRPSVRVFRTFFNMLSDIVFKLSTYIL